ncbi:MAG: 5-dehydro-2-deoxygluconokinase [Nitrospiraceae bacterium]|nr:5-dehydro-2-deoxygluconokinase [Nitrospiraceae bacterium]
MSTTKPYEVLTMGRIGVDVYPLEIGVPLKDVATFGKFLGGSATNVAVAAARHGRRSAVITRTGEDPFGEFAHDSLVSLGVDDRYVLPVHGLPTPVTFCEIRPPDSFPIWFYRAPKAPDLEINADELDMNAIESAGIFWITATGLSQEPSASAHIAALRARGRRRFTVLDLDYRPTFWPGKDSAHRAVGEVLPLCDVAVGNLEEAEVATGKADPETAGQALLDKGVDLAVVKMGPKGVAAIARNGERAVATPISVDVVNGLGAGDAFGGAFCHGLLQGWPLQKVLDFANAAGAIVASRLECSTAMPTTGEVEELLRRR